LLAAFFLALSSETTFGNTMYVVDRPSSLFEFLFRSCMCDVCLKFDIFVELSTSSFVVEGASKGYWNLLKVDGLSHWSRYLSYDCF
jgi:hypothetical protein